MVGIIEQKKKVLIGIHQLDHVGGAELYTYDLIKELKDHDDVEVEFFAINPGRLSEKIQHELGVPFMEHDEYDLILATHNSAVEVLHKHGPIVQICHGAILELEHPSPLADFHVGITDEVCESLTQKGYPNELILNGIDLEEKKNVIPVNTELQTVLSLCQSEKANELLFTACQEMDIEFKHFNKHKNPTFNIENEINKADLVVGIGRSVFDGMACGRPCLVFDWRGYNGNKGDGYLHPHLFDQYITTNCSGRYSNKSFNKRDIIKELEKYNAEDGEKLREIAEEKLNVKDTAVQLIEIDQIINWRTKANKEFRLFKSKFKQFRRSLKKRLKGISSIDVFKKK